MGNIKMGKDKKDLLDELKGGAANFIMVGKAEIKKESFSGEILKEDSTWQHVNSSFGIGLGDGKRSFVRLFGGYKLDDPKVYAFTDDGMIEIPWEERFDEEHLEKVNNRSLKVAMIEKDEENKMVKKQFLNEIDFEEYLSEHLEDGTDVRVWGNIEYRVTDNGRTIPTYNLQGVSLNESYKRGDDIIPAKEPEAVIRQTLLIDEDALPKNWERTLHEKGKVVISTFVPQYIGKKKVGDSWQTYKRTDPMHFPLTMSVNEPLDSEKFEESFEIAKKTVAALFKVKRGVVREFGAFVSIVDGYEEEKKDLVISKEMKQLLDLNIITMEDIESQVTTGGNRITEFVYAKPVFRKNDDGEATLALDDNKYAPEALIVPEMDDDESDGVGSDLFNEDKPKENAKEEKEDTEVGSISDSTFDDLFG